MSITLERTTVAANRSARPKAHSKRPSVLEPVRADLWFAQCPFADCLVFYFNQQPLYLLEGSTLDQASFNRMLFDMRCRYPRSA